MNRPGATSGPPRPPSSNLAGPNSVYRTNSAASGATPGGGTFPYGNGVLSVNPRSGISLAGNAGFGGGSLGALTARQTPQHHTMTGFGNGSSNGLLQQHRSQYQHPSPLPSHSLHRATTPSAVSISSNSELGNNGQSLDPMEFPALGSTPATLTNTLSGAVSYASQAGQASGQQGAIGATRERDFTADDFPALGGGVLSHQQQQQDNGHPPGLNGFQQQSLGLGLGPSTPGVLSLGTNANVVGRNIHPGLQQHHRDSDVEKLQQQRNAYSLKTNTSASQSAQAAWRNSPPPPATGPSANTTNGQQQHPSNAVNSYNGIIDAHTHLQQQQHPQAHSQPLRSQIKQLGHPQTPAQQVLVSAADRWGLLGLLAVIKNAGKDLDGGLSSGVGTDLGTMGLDVGYTGNLYSTFITPWSDSSAAHIVEPDFSLPACYDVRPPAPGPNKVAAFSDETLFFMFYSSPKDAMQEVAAQELWNRNWRFHKTLRLWITKETGTTSSQKLSGARGEGEQGQYTFWDTESWGKERKDMEVMYKDLEEKNVPSFLPGMTLVSASSAQAQQQSIQAGGQPNSSVAQQQPSQSGAMMVGGQQRGF